MVGNMKMQVEHVTENGKVNILELDDQERSDLVNLMQDGDLISMEYIENVGFKLHKEHSECECLSDYQNTGIVDANSCQYCMDIYRNLR